MPAAQTRTQADLRARLQQLPEGSPRRAALMAACTFKSSWVELGEALISVREEGQYKAWGYPSFEAYCKSELHIKADTVLKLTRSFAYLQQHAPERLSRSESTTAAPALDVVDLLSQAASRTKVSQDALSRMGAQLLQKDAAPTRAEVLKTLREDDPEAFRAKSRAAAVPKTVQDVDLRKALLLAERLFGLLGEQGDVVSAQAHAKLERVVQELRAAYGRKHPIEASGGDSNLVQRSDLH